MRPSSRRPSDCTAQTMRAMMAPQKRIIISPPQSIHQPMPSPECHIAHRLRGNPNRLEGLSPDELEDAEHSRLDSVQLEAGPLDVVNRIAVDVGAPDAHPQRDRPVHLVAGSGVRGMPQ